jgi:SAM-dependent methyltransferase
VYDAGDYFLSEYERQYGRSYVEDREHISRLGIQRLNRIEACLTRKGPRGGGGTKSRRERFLEISDRASAPGRLLDVGSALGFFLEVARGRKWVPLGVEVSSYAVSWCRRNLGVEVKQGSFLEIELEKEHFDAATLFFVAEHFKNVEKVIERVHYALKGGGVIAVALPNRGGVTYRTNRAAYVDEHPRDHYFDSCPRNLIRFMEECGFRKVRIRITGIHPDRFWRSIGLSKRLSLFDKVYTALARVLRLGDTFEYYGIKT